ncbi:MAG: 2-thiouracil desulfurase family protein [Lutibacter sp.]|nr:2-thiouracil desulfurase family protein [Lutibacter sp.]
MTHKNDILNLRIPTKENPLRILMSACLTGLTCGYDGTANGEYPSALKLLKYDTVKIIKFCPEEFSFGTPREMCDIHGGTGFDVLNGKAKVLTETGKDWTGGMIKSSEKMLEIAINEGVELAIMMDISAACGSQVIYIGNRFAENKVYQIGAGVSAAQLLRNGFKVISQRDYASLEHLYSKIDPNHIISENLIDHHETEWYKSYFKG